ncbi:hypothetical protein STA3757_43190 [Stanieria sp. NIES-3757]|nr:hypothetical protein STA3757_43190 [Stanieria sp. NIES-3757]
MQHSLASDNSNTRKNSNESLKKNQKFEGFDFLRAIFSIAVVALHSNLFIIFPELFGWSLISNILIMNVGYCAVPVFFQVSLFLFYLKREKTGVRYFWQKRLPKLISLYLFWVGLATVFELLFNFNEGFKSISVATSSLKSLVEFIVSGNSTPYYFFFSLIFVTIVAEILILIFKIIKKRSIRTKISYVFLFISLILIFTCSLFDSIIKYTTIKISWFNFLNNITHWVYNPLNFLPYVFTTVITFQEYKEGKLERITKWLKLKLYFLLFLASAFFILEWTLTNKGFLIQIDQKPLEHYMRLSLIFGSWLLLYLALLTKRQVPEIIQFISQCSLGIYGFHVFFTFERFFIFNNSLTFDKIQFSSTVFQTVASLDIVARFILALICSITLTLIFKINNQLKNFV